MSIETTLAEIEGLAEELKAGKGGALGALKDRVAGFTFIDLAESVSSRKLMVLYITKKVLRDVWANIGTDASFGFPENPDTEEYALVEELSLAIGKFVALGLSEGASQMGSECADALEVVISSYYRLILTIRDRELQAGPF